MSDKTKPSAGALRAATGCFNLPYGSAPTKSTADWTVEQMARIIDRETGVAELLEAAKDAEESLRHSIADAKAFRDPHADKLSLAISISSPWKLEMREERHAKLVVAIGKVEAK